MTGYLLPLHRLMIRKWLLPALWSMAIVGPVLPDVWRKQF